MLIRDLSQIGNKMHAVRKRLGLTQSEVAERASLSDRTYADMERGNVNIRMETLLKICDVLYVTPDELLTEQPDEAGFDEKEIIARLADCTPKERRAAIKILSAYLDSLNE